MTVAHEYTSKLFYNKYAWKIVLTLFSFRPPLKQKRISAATRRRQTTVTRKAMLAPILTWLSTNYPTNYRLLTSWRVITTTSPKETYDVCQLTVFISSQDAYDACLEKFECILYSTMAPANANHIDLIQQGAHIEVRDDLYYNKFRFKVSFWGGWWGKSREEIIESIQTQLHDDTKDEQQYRMVKANCTLYLKDQSDFMLIKLSLSPKIRETKVVSLFSEI